MQHIENNTEQNTEHNTERTEHSTQPQQNSAHTELYTYSIDFYHEYAYINNSNTIELYTILQDKI